MAQNQIGHDMKFENEAKSAFLNLDIVKYHNGTLQSQLPPTFTQITPHHGGLIKGIFRRITELCSHNHKQGIDYDVSLLRVTDRTIEIFSNAFRLGVNHRRQKNDLGVSRQFMWKSEYEDESDLLNHRDFAFLQGLIPTIVAA